MESGAHATAPASGASDRPEDLASREGAAASLAQDVGQQRSEELRMLMVGFGTGMTVALTFLIYIFMEAAHLLP